MQSGSLLSPLSVLGLIAIGAIGVRGTTAYGAPSPQSPFERALDACKKTIASPTDPTPAGLPDPTWPYSRDMTIRVLATNPFLFQTAEPGTRKQADWYWLRVSRGDADAALAALPIGALARVHYTAHLDRNSEPPPTLTAIASHAAPTAAEPALLAEWSPSRYAPQVQIYADGRALINASHSLIDTRLSQAELDDLLDSFAQAKFDTLPLSLPPDNHPVDREARVVLNCQGYRQVNLRDQAQALAPVVSAFERISNRAVAMSRPLLRAADTGSRPQIFAWPADAPPLTDDWYSQKYLAAKQAAAGDQTSPMYRPLPPDLAKAMAASQPRRPLIVRDRGVLWSIGVEPCDTCGPGTYSALRPEHPAWTDAPAWAPDFAAIGERGLWLDGQDPRLGTLHGDYRQRGEVYSVWQADAIPPAPARPISWP